MSKKVILSDNALNVAKSRYFHNGEDWEQCTFRVGKAVAEPEKDKQDYTNKFHEIIYNMDFIPGGRILRNAGRPKGSMLNCYVCPIQDSIEDIGQFIKDSLTLWSEGGGVGCNFSPLRPIGTPILGKGGSSSGLVSFIEAANAVSKTIESGGQRRAAALGCVDISHPEVIDFINAKLKDGRLNHFNISVIVNEEFLKAVESDSDWTFKFNQIEYKTIKAREIWDLIITNMIASAEPGLLNGTNLYKNNSYYFDPVVSTNPCIVGDTLIAVADGRGEVSIKQLAEEGKDVLIYSLNEATREIEIKMMRNPRITGFNQKILKVTLEDGSFIRCTENHKFVMKDGSIKEASNIKVNDRLHHMTKCLSNEISLYNREGKNQFNHRLLAEFKLGRKLNENEVVHHINGNHFDDSLDNLMIITQSEHDRIHQIGSNNVMRDKWWNKQTEERKNLYRERMKESTSGIKNGNSHGYTRDEMKEITKEFIKSVGREISVKEWFDFCKKNEYPYYSQFIWGKDKNPIDFLKEVSSEIYDIIKFNNYHNLREYHKFLEVKDGYDWPVIFEDNKVIVIKNCEHCGKEFKVIWGGRERCFCSRTCYNKSSRGKESIRNYQKEKLKNNKTKIAIEFLNLKDELKRDLYLYELQTKCRENGVSLHMTGTLADENHFGYYKDIKDYVENSYLNYKVTSVEEDGYEDVYNGTVDDNHNFYIMTKEDKTRFGNRRFNYINCPQCGEAVLENYGSCCLGSLVLPNFITGTTNTNWQKLERTIKIAIRFLDNVIDVNKYTLKEIDLKAHNSRRIGLGIMGLADYLFAKELRYGSKDALLEIEKLMRFIRDTVYQSSVEIAMEKGSFPKFDPVLYGNASFVRKLPASLRLDIKSKGIRNVTCMSIAPTGTISLLKECSGGIEPLMYKSYKRNDKVGERIYIYPKYKQLLLNGGDSIPDWFVDSTDLTPKDHFETLAIIQKYVDGAVSKTINMPKGTTSEDLSTLLLEYVHELKGCTVYVDGSRGGQVYNKLSEEEAIEYIAENTVSDSLSIDDVECNCQKPADESNTNKDENCLILT